jgi:hypothetical protein
MSTKFSGGRVLQAEFWELHGALREKLIQNHPLLTNIVVSDAKPSLTIELMKQEIFHYNLQLFQVNEYFYFRFLSQGYFIENNISEWEKEGIFPESYQFIGFHTGAQSHDEVDDEFGEGTIDLVHDVLDPMILEQRFFTVILVDDTTLMDQFYWKARQSRKETTKNE